jgi:hypothetical protein
MTNVSNRSTTSTQRYRRSPEEDGARRANNTTANRSGTTTTSSTANSSGSSTVTPTSDTYTGQTSGTSNGPVRNPDGSIRPSNAMSTQEVMDEINNRINSGNFPPTAAGLHAMVAELQAMGANVVLGTHEGGRRVSSDAIVLPNGHVIDLIGSVGAPDARWLQPPIDHGSYEHNRNVLTPSGEMKPYREYLAENGLPTPPWEPGNHVASPSPPGPPMPSWLDMLMNMIGQYVSMGDWSADELNDPNNNSPKNVFGRWIQMSKLKPSAAALKAFTTQHPDFEVKGTMIRVKPSAAAKYGISGEPPCFNAITGSGDNARWSWTPVNAMDGDLVIRRAA